MERMTRKQIDDRIRRLAEAAFKDHVLAAEHGDDRSPYRAWFCSRPNGGSVYHFRVVAMPGAVAIYGDIGDAIFRSNDRDALQWLRTSIKSCDYVLGKITNSSTRWSQFYPELAENLLARLVEEAEDDPPLLVRNRKRAEEIRSAWGREDGGDAGAFGRAWYEGTDGDAESISATWHFCSEALWIYEAARWFCEALERLETAPAPAPAPPSAPAAAEPLHP